MFTRDWEISETAILARRSGLEQSDPLGLKFDIRRDFVAGLELFDNEGLGWGDVPDGRNGMICEDFEDWELRAFVDMSREAIAEDVANRATGGAA